MSRGYRRSPLALAVLALLAEEPMHAYRMQQLIKERHKDDVVNVAQRNSVYQTIERLLRDELIEVMETTRDQRRPERTVYRITRLGARTAQDWLKDMLAAPAREFPEFPAALAFMPLLEPSEALARLEDRTQALADQLERIEGELAEGGAFLPRIFLVESEYAQAVTRAELAWVRALVQDMREGLITWDFRLLTADHWATESSEAMAPAEPTAE